MEKKSVLVQKYLHISIEKSNRVQFQARQRIIHQDHSQKVLMKRLISQS